MNFFKHHIGDYRRDTAHLTLLEHGVYRQLLDTYYLHEGPIQLEREQVYRKLMARTDEERRAIDAILDEFFEQTERGFVHGRCETELAEYRNRAETARVNGRLGGRKPNRTEQEPTGNPDGTESGTERKANHKPITKNQEPTSSASPISVDLFTAFWSAYPRKVAKPEAMKAWIKIKPDEETFSNIMTGLASAKNSRDWTKDDGQFIPHPATWLNQRRWEDQLEAAGGGGDSFEGLI